MDIDTYYTSSMFQEYEEQNMDEMKVDDKLIFSTQFRENMVSESEKDIIEKRIETIGGEEKDANNDDFVTQANAGKKAEGEKTTAIERPKWVIKMINKFIPTKKKKTVQKTV
ncbi:hypothetical protein PanWU01x14_114770 [Parasponia andersonii]|uniref:Uncharacterized protein n=1 Tax=Parasponia andersonii TaxID=3476 RepID=A0A2P5CXG4_PARAD|nr:hypothetical protein PanWU01x14_114770 [Parasponia andersonii]